MGNKSGVLVAKISLWMLEMLLKWALKITSFPGKAFGLTLAQWKLSNPPQSGLSQSLYMQLQCSRWGAKQPGSSFGLIFPLHVCPKKIARGHAHNK